MGKHFYTFYMNNHKQEYYSIEWFFFWSFKLVIKVASQCIHIAKPNLYANVDYFYSAILPTSCEKG